jgi:hypothetical protein
MVGLLGDLDDKTEYGSAGERNVVCGVSKTW